MKTEDFNYDLPESLIAQTPLKDRDTSRLMVLDKATGEIEHKHFYDIIDYLEEGDVLVLNDTKVMPARLFGIKEETGSHIEILMLKELENDLWECLVRPAKRISVGTVVDFGEGLLKATCISEEEEGIRIFKFNYQGIFYEILDKLGEMPLPPYIQELLEKIAAKGVKIEYVTLHVGLGTFRPVTSENVLEHQMHSEYYVMKETTANVLNEAKKNGSMIVSVGTTSTRVLETVMNRYGKFEACSGWTNIFIYPGYKFKAIDYQITNFHLPKSTLIMLVSALAGRENILNAYNIAVKERYRFFSFGDAMLIK